jgi:acetyltransferase-like isoleucine patch superfamily enzyme
MTTPSFLDLVPSSSDAALRSQILGYAMTEHMTDRERARFLGLPEGCRMRERAKILCPEKFQCGKNVWIGEGAVLDAQGGLTIGDESQIGLNVMIWSHSSHAQALKGETGSSRDRIIYKATSIGSNCFIAGPSVILPGVTIGNGVLIPAMSVVSEDLPDGAIFKDNGRELKKLRNKVETLEKKLAELLERLPKP